VVIIWVWKLNVNCNLYLINSACMWNVFSCYFFASLMVDGKLLNLEGNLFFF